MEGQKSTTSSLFDVYLRLRPSFAPSAERFIDVEDACNKTHITLRPPQSETHRKRAVERFGFTKVFEEDATQKDLFDGTGMIDILEGIVGKEGREGRDGLVATLGNTGSGKSHTILGSRTQRGLTQLTLDVLYQNIGHQLAEATYNESVFPSLCAADVSEAQLMSASTFLEAIYGDGDTNGRGHSRGPSRATTPLMVGSNPLRSPNPRDRHKYHRSCVQNKMQEEESRPQTLHPNLYPILRSTLATAQTTASTAKRASKRSPDMSVLSGTARPSTAQGSNRRYLPRLSALPQKPSSENINLTVDATAEYAITLSMYEVYNDRIFDLLASPSSVRSPNPAAHAARRRALLYKPTEASPDRKVVAGLRKVVCANMEEALLVLETGLQERKVTNTGSNAVSSRSHGFFSIEVKKRAIHPSDNTIVGPWSSSALTIVDLAGSERAKGAKTAGSTLAEAGKINESLMYLGQCMQLATSHSPDSNVVPFRQCKLTELLFSNSFPGNSSTNANANANNKSSRRAPQKALMIVTANAQGDFNATAQILRYGALAREVTVPRLPSYSKELAAAAAPSALSASVRSATAMSGRITPSAALETSRLADDLEAALRTVQALSADLEVCQVRLDEERARRKAVEVSWKAAEQRVESVEAEIRDEVHAEMEARLQSEMRRWRAARESDSEAQGELLDRKLDVLSRGLMLGVDGVGEAVEVYEDVDKIGEERVAELEKENRGLRERIEKLEGEKVEKMRSPSKKIRVLKARRWEGSDLGVGLEGSP